MLKKFSINQLLFISHLILVLVLIAGMSYSRYQSEWESRVLHEVILMEQSMSPFMRDISAAVAGRNYTAVTMPSHKDTLASIETLLFLDIQGTSDYQDNQIGVRYARELDEIWRVDVSEQEIASAREDFKTLLAKQEDDNLSHVTSRKLFYLVNKAEKDLEDLEKSQRLTKEFTPPWPIDPIPSKYAFFPEHGIAALQLPLFNINGGHVFAIFDASKMFSFKADIYATIAVEATTAILVSLLLIAGVTHWLVAPLRRLAAQMNKDIEQLNIASLE